MKEMKRHQGQQCTRFEDEEDKIHVECRQCKEVKPEDSDFFYKQKTTKSGLRSTCKTCCDEYHMNRYENEEGFKEKLNENARIWREDNIDRAREKGRERYKKRVEESPELVRAENRKTQQQWKEKHPAGIYKITCIENSRVYIGQSKSIRSRWVSHKSSLNCKKGKTNALLQEDWDRFGETKFKFEVVKILPKDRTILLKEEAREIYKVFRSGVATYNAMITSEQRKLLQENK